MNAVKQYPLLFMTKIRGVIELSLRFPVKGCFFLKKNY